MAKKPGDRFGRVGAGDVNIAAHWFEGARLTLARELRGITRAELAERIGKTPSAVSQFEGGRSKPDPRTLAGISLALGVPLGFFVRQGKPLLAVDSCHFRTLRSASQRERKRLLSVGTLLVELVNELETDVEFPPEQVSMAGRTPSSLADIEACAAAVRAAWKLGQGPLPNVTKLLQSKGVVVCLVPPTCREVDAFSAWQDGRPLVFLVSDRQGARMRFDAAHELGHLVMHPDAAPGSPELEREANRFSGAFLIPRDPFLAEWPGWLNWEHLHEMKRRWKVSLAAIVRRAYDLGVLSEPSYRRANIALRQLGAEPFEPDQEAPDLLSKALGLFAEEVPLTELAERQGLSVQDIEALVRGHILGGSSDAVPFVEAQQLLFDRSILEDHSGALTSQAKNQIDP
jgi:Zn-dependent peptidase ImmA (M78 family)/transcriptional regulator with XRE-family HTH domain